jgi:hypothetical protein
VQDLSITRIESLLGAGDVRQALKLAGKNAEQHPRDPAARLLLGRVHFARAVIGRYPALEEFRAAARLAPGDPEPWYWQMKVGFYLRGDDGDWIAREALLRLFALDPDYRDSWERFRDVYSNADIWSRAERALAAHGDQPIALERRAELLIALNAPARADSLLALVPAAAATVKTCLLRAEATVLAGRPEAGFAWHDSALARAEHDVADALWEEAWLIASPDEVARHAALVPEDRRAFFEQFWARRDPNVLTPRNERLAEHYARRAEARRRYRLLHPQRTLYHSRLARTLAGLDGYRELVDPAQPEPGLFPGSTFDLLRDERRAAAMSQRALQDTAVPLAFRAGLTAPGLVFLRYGKPDLQANCVSDLAHQGLYKLGCTSHLTEEAWYYRTPQGPLSVHFRGNEFFEPTSPGQLHDSFVLLSTDRTSVPAPLSVQAWTAVFMSSELGLSDVYYKARGDSFAVALWSQGAQPARVVARALAQVRVPAGSYDLGLDVDSAGVLGRIRAPQTVPSFSLVDLSLSSLVLAPVGRGHDDALSLPDRETALQGMPTDLAFRSGAPLAAYVEVYGLGQGRGNRSHYQVRYSFAPIQSALARLFGSARPVVFEFERGDELAIARERLVIEPHKLAAGRYRVTVSVTDLTRNVKSESVALDITIR